MSRAPVCSALNMTRPIDLHGQRIPTYTCSTHIKRTTMTEIRKRPSPTNINVVTARKWNPATA